MYTVCHQTILIIVCHEIDSVFIKIDSTSKSFLDSLRIKFGNLRPAEIFETRKRGMTCFGKLIDKTLQFLACYDYVHRSQRLLSAL